MPVLKFDDVSYTVVSSRVKRKLIHTGNLMTVLIDFTEGPWTEPDPPHSHPHEQTSYVAKLFFIVKVNRTKYLRKVICFLYPPTGNTASKLSLKPPGLSTPSIL